MLLFFKTPFLFFPTLVDDNLRMIRGIDFIENTCFYLFNQFYQYVPIRTLRVYLFYKKKKFLEKCIHKDI